MSSAIRYHHAASFSDFVKTQRDAVDPSTPKVGYSAPQKLPFIDGEIAECGIYVSLIVGDVLHFFYRHISVEAATSSEGRKSRFTAIEREIESDLKGVPWRPVAYISDALDEDFRAVLCRQWI